VSDRNKKKKLFITMTPRVSINFDKTGFSRRTKYMIKNSPSRP